MTTRAREIKVRFLLSKWRGEQLAGSGFEPESQDQTDALETVKYWLLDVLVHKRPVSDPRAILKRVEDAL